MSLLKINFPYKFDNRLRELLVDLSYGMFELEPKMYNFYLNKLLLIITSASLCRIKPKVNRLEGIQRVGGCSPPGNTNLHSPSGSLGPHNIDIISRIFGSLLGNAYAEKLSIEQGTIVTLFQEGIHIEYIYFLHKLFSYLGYCNPKPPKITTRLGVKGKIFKKVEFSTWSYTSFNWIYDLWYKNNIKCVPECISSYLTPLTLATWVMNNGARVGKILKFSKNYYTYKECLILIKALNNNFNLKAYVELTGSKDKYTICICKESMENLRKIICPYMVPEMKHKII